jgi:hypothetical protein
MDATQLRERLLVAETLMKKLYNRNKVVEGFLGEKYLSDKQSEANPEDAPNLALVNSSQREKDLMIELDEKQK